MLDTGFLILGDLTTDYTDRRGANGEGVFQPPTLLSLLCFLWFLAPNSSLAPPAPIVEPRWGSVR